MWEDAGASRTFTVLVNEEGQYGLWREGDELPPGWSPAGMSGLREECMRYVEKVWHDLRPLSVRAAADRRRAGVARSEVG